MTPSVHPDAYVAATAVLSGQVSVGAGSCVRHGAVLTADGGAVDVAANCVIMENAVLRGTPRHPLVIGDHVLAGPNSYLTGCRVEDEVCDPARLYPPGEGRPDPGGLGGGGRLPPVRVRRRSRKGAACALSCPAA